MSTTTTLILSPDPAKTLAWAKATAGIPLGAAQRKLVVLELARRAHLADSDHPNTGHEWQILRATVPADPNRRVGAFADLVAAFDDWTACHDDVDGWRYDEPHPRSRDSAFEYVDGELASAVNALLGLAAVTA